MRTLYLDLFSGISGDMFVGALLDLGVEAGKLEKELAKLRLGGYHLHALRSTRGSIEGVKFEVHVEAGHEHEHAEPHHPEHPPLSDHHHHSDESAAHSQGHGHAHSHSHGTAVEGHSRTFAEIKQMIDASPLSAWVKEKSIAVFKRIAVAEGKVHGLPPEQVHFHEVGAVDSIVDIVGACVGLELLGRPRALASAVVDGTGWVNCAHGRFPVPSPATLAILGARGIPLTQCDETHELVTPTGAALLAELVEQFGPMKALIAERIGFGLGSRENRTRPNVLRAVLGEAGEAPPTHDWQTDTVVVLRRTSTTSTRRCSASSWTTRSPPVPSMYSIPPSR